MRMLRSHAVRLRRRQALAQSRSQHAPHTMWLQKSARCYEIIWTGQAAASMSPLDRTRKLRDRSHTLAAPRVPVRIDAVDENRSKLSVASDGSDRVDADGALCGCDRSWSRGDVARAVGAMCRKEYAGVVLGVNTRPALEDCCAVLYGLWVRAPAPHDRARIARHTLAAALRCSACICRYAWQLLD